MTLSERLERAEGPSRELDLEIARLMDTVVLRQNDEDTGSYETTNWRYTASIDAALTLMPENMAWVLYSDGPTYRASAEIGPHPHGGELFQARFEGEGETPVLALCAAALKARETSGE